MKRVITISREFGSRGHSIGKKVATRLQIPFYDEELVEKVAHESGYDVENVEDLGEHSSWIHTMFDNISVMTGGNYIDPRDTIYEIQKKVILELARKEPCVIVGRCSDRILKKAEIDALHVFIFADIEFRKKCILERYGETGVPIDKRVRQKDKMRKTYYKYYTDEDWGQMKNYNLSLDSGFLGEDLCVDLIVKAAE